MTQPLAAIQVALKHKRRKFLSQTGVFGAMRQEWFGGGYSEDQNVFVQKIVLPWAALWWVVLPYSMLLQVITAWFPPFHVWYESYTSLRARQTIERQLLGLSFIPSFRYAVAKAKTPRSNRPSCPPLPSRI